MAEAVEPRPPERAAFGVELDKAALLGGEGHESASSNRSKIATVRSSGEPFSTE